MFTTEQKKTLREEFWQEFKVYSNQRKLKSGKPGKWIMNDTGIKQLILKFHFDEEKAFAGIEINTRNVDKRIDLFDKLEKLKTILTKAVPYSLCWELESSSEGIQSISRVYSILENVSIYDKNCWKKVFKFLFDIMEPVEVIFLEYKDFLKY
jgi:hypothetical protein